MNELTVDDLLEMSDMWVGKESDKERKATQKDIDKFFG